MNHLSRALLLPNSAVYLSKVELKVTSATSWKSEVLSLFLLTAYFSKHEDEEGQRHGDAPPIFQHIENTT